MARKTRSVFLREEERIVHGQKVMVAIYGDEVEKPELAAGKYLDELVGCSSLRTKEIAETVAQYKRDCNTAALKAASDVKPEITVNFLHTEEAEEEDSIEFNESFIPLDKQLEKLGIT